MDDEFIDAATITHDIDEVYYVFPLVKVVDAEAAFDCYWDIYRMNHLLTYVGHEFRGIH